MNKNEIILVISKVAKENKINLDINNLNIGLKDIGIDSLALMNLIFKLENELKVQLPDEILIKIKNLNELIIAFEDQINKK